MQQQLRRLILTSSLLVFALLFSACTQSIKIESESLDPNQLFQRSNGNGGHYGGKLENGTYARVIPDSQCGTQTMGEVIVSDEGILSRELDTNSCQVSETQIDLGLMDYALYLQGRVGLSEGLYTKREETPVLNANEEVWCRGEDSGPSSGFDVVIKADYQNRKFEAHVVSATQNRDGSIEKQVRAPISVSRDLDMFERARYRSGGFELDIRTNSPAQWAGTIQADLELGDQDYRLYCRLGGQLDRKSNLKPF